MSVPEKRNLFAYGTLLVPEIWDLVVGKSFQNEAAALSGYQIRRVKNGDFPGMVATNSEDESSLVRGEIFFDLDEEAIARLDAYEDAFYDRIEVEAVLTASGETIVCDSYVIAREKASEILGNEVWTLDWFISEAKAEYLRRMRV